MTWGGLHDGDWVRADRNISTGILGGTTINAGSKGVVTTISSGWFTSRAEVDFGSGLGTVRANVPTHQLRLVRRDGGIDRFSARQRRVAPARMALLLFLAWPIIWW